MPIITGCWPPRCARTHYGGWCWGWVGCGLAGQGTRAISFLHNGKWEFREGIPLNAFQRFQGGSDVFLLISHSIIHHSRSCLMHLHPSMRLGQSILHAPQVLKSTGRSRVLRWPMVKKAGAFASLLPTRVSEGLPGTHPLCISHILADLQLVPLCSPTPKRQWMAPMLSLSPKSRVPEPSYPIRWLSIKDKHLHSSTAPTGSMSISRMWTLLSGPPINFHKVSTVQSIPMFFI